MQRQDSAEVPLAERLLSVPAGQPRRALLEGAVKDEVGAVLRLPAARVPVDRALKELGLDSLMALELRHRLERRTGTRLTPSLAWNYPTVRGLADHLAGRLEIPLEADTPADREGADDGELMALLTELEQLNDDEAQRLLAEGGRG
jgi:acyl carrier protein